MVEWARRCLRERLARWRLTGGVSIEQALYLCLLVLGVPACLLFFVLRLWPAEMAPALRFNDAERHVEALTMTDFNDTGFARLAATLPRLEDAAWQRVALPDAQAMPLAGDTPDTAQMARAWFRLRYTVPADAAPNTLFALHVGRIIGGAYTVWLDGQLIAANLEHWRMQWNSPVLVTLPLAATPPGRHIELYLALPYRVEQGYALGTAYIGPESALLPRFQNRVLWQQDLPRAILVVVLVLGLSSLQFWLSRRSETEHLLMSCTAFAWLVCNSQYFLDFSTDSFSARWCNFIVDASISWVIALTYFFAARFYPRRFSRLEWTLLAYVVAQTVFTAPLWDWQTNGLLLMHCVDLLVLGGLTLFMSWLARRGAPLEFRLLTLAMWSMAILGLHDMLTVSAQRFPDEFHLMPYAAVSLFGAFLFATNRRYLGALARAEQLNATLDARVRQSEAELELRHQDVYALQAQQAELQREQERLRLTRDIHDGIGTRLITSQIEVMYGQLDSVALAVVLEDCMLDLRLVLQSRSLDVRDLPSVLGTVRHQLGKSMRSAGIRIDWQMADDLPPIDWLQPSHALDLMRALLETLVNIQKHADADTVTVCTALAPADAAGPWVEVTISDNGRGFDADQTYPGHGLGNMRYRLTQLGGRLQLSSKAGAGTIIVLAIPVHAPQPV